MLAFLSAGTPSQGVLEDEVGDAIGPGNVPFRMTYPPKLVPPRMRVFLNSERNPRRRDPLEGLSLASDGQIAVPESNVSGKLERPSAQQGRSILALGAV